MNFKIYLGVISFDLPSSGQQDCDILFPPDYIQLSLEA